MSTKIYNGFMFKENYSLLYIKELATRFRNIIQPIIVNKVNTIIADIAVRCIDAQALLGTTNENCPLLAGIHAFEERQHEVKKTNRRDPMVDMEFSICIIPTKDKILGITYTEQNDLLRLWLEQEEIVQYPYWDNTDPPEDLSWEEWEKRGKEWDEALKEAHGIPAMNGLTIEFVNQYSYGMPHAEAALACMPTFEQRKKHWTKRLAIDYATKQVGVEDSAWKQYSAAKDWLKTDKGKAYIKQAAALVEEKLPHIITKDMLLKDMRLKDSGE